MSTIVDYDGPLTRYLQDVDDNADVGSTHSFARTPAALRPGPGPTGSDRTKSQQHEPFHRTLIMADRASSRHSRFQTLFSTAMSPRLSPRESSRFVDRFRYVICTSQLLSESIVASEYRKSTGDIATFQLDSGEQAQWDSRKAAKHWMGSGGCVLLVTLVLTWALRAPDRGIEPKTRASATLVLSLAMCLFLYAQSRRNYTRRLYSLAVTHMQSLVFHCQNFDSATCKIINVIQEVELVSRGYKIGAVMPPIARIEANAKQRRCIRLRAALVSALNLIHTAIGRACSCLDILTDLRDYNKLSDVYNIIINDEDDVSSLCDEADSIGYLKALFHQMHARRRKVLCCLLAVHANGRSKDIRVWKVVVEQLETISDLMSSLAKQLEDTFTDDAHLLNPNQMTPAFSDEGPIRDADKRRCQARGINNLSQTLRRTQAKMYILREESSRILQQPEIGTHARDELLEHYDSLGADLHALLADWEDGRQMLAKQGRVSQQLEPEDTDAGKGLTSDTVESLSTSALLIRPNSLGNWGPRMSVYNTNDGSSVEDFMLTRLEEALHEEVFEGQTAPEISSSERTQVSRAERIATMRQERALKQAKSEERRLQAQARQSLQGELKDVLGHRGRRPLSLSMNISSRRSATRRIPADLDSVLSSQLDSQDRKISTSSQQSTNTMNSGLGSSVFSDAQ